MRGLIQIDALKIGEMGRIYRVGTFPKDRGTAFRAYTRDYSAYWPGCVEYLVSASSGREAKRAAAAHRKAAYGREEDRYGR